MKKVILLLLICTISYAEKIYLKNGDIITGTVIETTEDIIVVKTEQDEIEIKKEDIERIEYTEKETSKLKEMNSAIIWRPLPTVLAAILGYTDLVFEGQTAFTKEFAITAIGEFGSIYDIFIFSLQLGPQYRPNGDYLKGFILGLYPGVGYITNFITTIWFFSMTFETGYQWVSDSGFILGLTTGGSYVGGNPYISDFKFNISVHIGIAYKDPFFSAK